jgi:magnesium transporter
MIDYNESTLKEITVEDFSECKDFVRKSVKWIDFDGVDQTNDVQEIGEIFTLHPLLLEDIANIQQRPKLEDMEDYIFVSLKMFDYRRETQTLDEEQISLVLGQDYLISFQEKDENDDFEIIKERIRK